MPARGGVTSMPSLVRITEITLKIVAFIIGLLMISLAMIFAGVYFFDINAHRFLLEQQFHQLTGDTIHLNGPVSVSISPTPTIQLNQVEITASQRKVPIKISVNKLGFKINPVNLFANYVHLYDVSANDIKIASLSPDHPWEKKIDSFQGKIDTGPATVNFSKINMKLGKNTLKGKIQWVKLGKNNQIDADLTSPSWQHDESQSEDIVGLLTHERIAGKLHWKCDALTWSNIDIKNADLNLTKEPNVLTVTAKGDIPGGEFNTDITINQLKSTPNYQGKLSLNANDPMMFIKKWMPSVPLSLTDLKLHIEGQSEGKNLTEIKQHFKGTLEGSSNKIILKGNPHDAVNPSPNFTLQDVEANFKVTQDQTHVESKGKCPGGEFKGDFWIKPDHDNPHIIADLSVIANNSAEFLQAIAPELKLSGGNLKVHLQGTTAGKSFESWKSQFKGHLFLHIQNMTVQGQSIDSRLVDVFALFWQMFAHTEKETLFECLASRFIVHDGILLANENFAVETPEIYALGTGSIDFNKDWLGLSFDVYPRSKMPLQIGAYDNVVSIRGPFKEPNVSATNGLIAKGGSVALSVATGGMSTLVQKFLEIVRERGSPCAKVLATEKEEMQQTQ